MLVPARGGLTERSKDKEEEGSEILLKYHEAERSHINKDDNNLY